jgi:hypothetical protein
MRRAAVEWRSEVEEVAMQSAVIVVVVAVAVVAVVVVS